MNKTKSEFDLESIQKTIDHLLENTTEEQLSEWLTKHRNNNKTKQMIESIDKKEMILNYLSTSNVLTVCLNEMEYIKFESGERISKPDPYKYCKLKLEELDKRKDSISAIEFLNELELDVLKQLHEQRLED